MIKVDSLIYSYLESLEFMKNVTTFKGSKRNASFKNNVLVPCLFVKSGVKFNSAFTISINELMKMEELEELMHNFNDAFNPRKRIEFQGHFIDLYLSENLEFLEYDKEKKVSTYEWKFICHLTKRRK